MASSLNRVTLIGALGKDPEVRTTQNGSKIANLSLATGERWKDKQSGEMKERTEWHKVAVFNDGTVGYLESYAKKGTKLYVEGALQTRKWTNQQGQDQYTTEVVVSAFRGEVMILSGGVDGSQRDGGQRQQQRPAQGGGAGADLDDEVPFAPCWQ